MENFLTYLEAHKTKRKIIGIVNVTNADIEALAKLPDKKERLRQMDEHCEKAKREFIKWQHANGGRINGRLPGTPQLIIAGSYEFWQKAVKAMRDGDFAFAEVTGIDGNDIVATI